MNKHRLLLILVAMVFISSLAYAETDYSYLDDMTINQLKELDAEIHKRIPLDADISFSFFGSDTEGSSDEAESGIKEDDEYTLLFDNEFLTVYAKRFEDKSILENSTPPFYFLGFKLHMINKTKDKYMSLGISNLTVGKKNLSAFFYGCDYVAPESELFTELKINRLLSEDKECAFVTSYDELVDLKGVIQIYYNTDGSRAGKGLKKVNFKLY